MARNENWIVWSYEDGNSADHYAEDVWDMKAFREQLFHTEIGVNHRVNQPVSSSIDRQGSRLISQANKVIE